MKRGADRQISKGEDEYETEEVSGESFQKADNAVLATRKIKGMPRRTAGSLSPFPSSSSDVSGVNGTPENPSTPPPSKFGSFTGFGSPASNSNPFSFTPPTSSPSFPAASLSSNVFRTTPAAPSTLFGSGTPAVAATASNAAKTFASFLGDTSSKSTTNATPPPPLQTDKPTSATDAHAVDDAAVKYYTSLRGLNVSVLAAITKAIDEDPFIDVANLLTRYSNHRVDVQKEFDQRRKPDGVPPAPAPFSFSTPPSSAAAPSSAFKMPSAPSTFPGFGQPSAAATPQPNDKTESPTPSSNFFSPTASASTSTSISAPKPSIFSPSLAPKSAFGAATTSSFGTSSASPFGSNTSPSPFGGKTLPLFSSGSPSAFGSSPSTPFSFGGSASGSIGNPVGFAFGSGLSGGASKAASTAGEASKDAKSESTGEPEVEEVEASGSQETEKASTPGMSEEGSSGILFGSETPSGMDAEGEGEEDEETVHSARLKAFRMKPKDKGGEGGWFDMGIGFLRLKRHKDTSARRLLLRNSHTGKIQINFALYSGLKVSQSKKAITFVGHDDAGESQTYSLRLRTEEMAVELKNALEKEIAQVNPS
ncbi:hypothetical protein B0H10DRAFT_2001201 [Mycena sp. CBHHK59/15]|nr:hypothetical protein B0H10DRAFT_2001201 [Mycena sp. CBHHK59/15]